MRVVGKQPCAMQLARHGPGHGQCATRLAPVPPIFSTTNAGASHHSHPLARCFASSVSGTPCMGWACGSKRFR